MLWRVICVRVAGRRWHWRAIVAFAVLVDAHAGRRESCVHCLVDMQLAFLVECAAEILWGRRARSHGVLTRPVDLVRSHAVTLTRFGVSGWRGSVGSYWSRRVST